MDHEQLPEYVHELIYRAIATKFKIGKQQLASSPEAQAKVSRFIMAVKAIAEADTLNEAVARLLKMHSLGVDSISHEAITQEVNECYEAFAAEIAGVERMHEMNRLKIDSKSAAIWEYLRANVRLGSEYEDDWLQAADAWILRGEKLKVELGTATICSFQSPADEMEFVQEVIQAQNTKHQKAAFQDRILSCRTEQALLDDVKSLLCKAIASRLKIEKADYDESLGAQHAVSRCLINVMSIVHNNGEIELVLKELCMARHFGQEVDNTVLAAMRTEIVATLNTFRSEIAAFRAMHEMNQAGASTEATWTQIQTMVILGEDYK
ncbi:MAG: hypothetical protein WCO84_07630 [bacterium]